jgi:hypothetical protein
VCKRGTIEEDVECEDKEGREDKEGKDAVRSLWEGVLAGRLRHRPPDLWMRPPARGGVQRDGMPFVSHDAHNDDRRGSSRGGSARPPDLYCPGSGD